MCIRDSCCLLSLLSLTWYHCGPVKDAFKVVQYLYGTPPKGGQHWQDSDLGKLSSIDWEMVSHYLSWAVKIGMPSDSPKVILERFPNIVKIVGGRYNQLNPESEKDPFLTLERWSGVSPWFDPRDVEDEHDRQLAFTPGTSDRHTFRDHTEWGVDHDS